MTELKHRHDFILIFDVKNGNPNGDPDAGNMPRIDPLTNQGLITDVCLKRKIRNYIQLAKEGEEGFDIYVQDGDILENKHREAYKALGLVGSGNGKLPKKLNPDPKTDQDIQLRDWMCKNFYDIRAFGAVMSTSINCGQVRGPVQLTFASSVEPIQPAEITITRMAATNEKEQKKKDEGTDEGEMRTENRTMGRKYIVPYGLYVAHGFVSASLAKNTSFSSEDLGLLFEAMGTMFEHDRSAARGEMTTQKLVAFRHSSKLGNAPAHKLFECIKIGRQFENKYYEIGAKELQNLSPARKFSDYQVRIERDEVPDEVEILEFV